MLGATQGRATGGAVVGGQDSVVTAITLLVWGGLPHAAIRHSGPTTAAQPSLLLVLVQRALRLTYRIRYHALDRKVRKIVKNKYRFVRTYVCVREWHRVRLGLRLLVTGVAVQSARQ